MSIVRNNLLNQYNYTPYCGSVDCKHGMPRTRFNGEQFACTCGWQSKFESEFIEQYQSSQEALKSQYREVI